MITGLVIAALTGFVVWLVRYIREGRAITRALRSDPFILDPTPPTRAEISGEFLIPPSMVSRFAKGGPVYRIARPGRTVYSPFSPRDARPGDVWHDTSDDTDIQYRVRQVTRSALPTAEPAPTGCQHPNPEPVVLTTAEVVAGVCPDCLQPLPPSSVGSEWKP